MMTRTEARGTERPVRPDTELVLHPHIAALRSQCEALRARLSELLELQAMLVEHTAPRLEALYTEQLGRLELALLEVQARNACLLRRIELLRALLNRGEAITPAHRNDIDSQIRREQFEWEERLRAAEHRMRDANALLQAQRLSEQDAGMLKELYRRLVRRLHPDMTGGETEQYRRYWNEIQSAYHTGDLKYLELLAEIICGEGNGGDLPFASTMGALEAEIQRLMELVRLQVERIAELRRNPPLCYEAQLRDTGWITARQDEIAASIRREEERHAALVEELRMLLPDEPAAIPTVH